MKRLFILLVAFAGFVPASYAQFFLTGQDPASIRWKQLQTEHFRFIFPEEYSLQALKAANIFETVYPAVLSDLAAPARKTSVIMHNRSVVSNAMVAFAPTRVELFNTPPQENYAQQWYKQLAIHELRHVAQLNKINTAFTNELTYLFGEQIVAGIFGLYLPFYFVEGDAVVTETALGNSGRGRQPLFEAGLRAQLLEIGPYRHDKAYFGSFRDHVPNVYELGYFVVGHNKLKYGPGLWENALARTARRPWMLVPYSSGLRQKSGLGKNGLYKQTMAELYEIWKAQYDTLSYTPVANLSSERKTYTNYRFPELLSNGSVIATRSSLDDILRIVKFDNGVENVLFTPGPTFREALTATDSLVAWAEYRSDHRWSNASYAVIQLGDIKTGTVRSLTRKSRFFAPDLSADDKKIVVAETDALSRNYLVVMETQEGQELFRMGSDSLHFQTPKWMHDGLHVLSTVIGKNGKALIKVNTITAETEILLPYTFTDFSLASVSQDYVILNGAWSGINNIYALRLADRQVFQLTSSVFGATDAVWDANRGHIVYSDYNSKGFRLVEAAVDDLLWLPLAEVQFTAYPLADGLSQMSDFNADEAVYSEEVYHIKKFSKLGNLINIHSWSPFYFETSNPGSTLGFSLFSQNLLSTAVAELGFNYDPNEQTGQAVMGFEYHGWFPILSVNASTGRRRGKTEFDGTVYNLSWSQSDWDAGLRVPLNFNSGKWIRGVQPAFRYRQIYQKMDEDVGLTFKKDLIHAFEYDLFAYVQMRSSRRDIYPRFGQLNRIIYRHSAFDDLPAEQFFVNSMTFLPGIFRHHGLRIYGAYQWQQTGLWSFGNAIAFPRGYNGLFFNENLSFKADYVFPIAYPDWNLPTIFLLQRLRAGFFTDWFYGRGSNPSTELMSAGVELHSDWHFLNLPFPVAIGGRLSYTHTEEKLVFEMLFNINLTTLY